MMHKFIITGCYWRNTGKCFPSLNDMLAEAERHPRCYAKLKRDLTYVAVNSIRRDLKGYKAKGVVIPHYIFVEPKTGQKRDYDNISAAARKIINDALVKTKTIVDDNPNYLMFGTSEFKYGNIPSIEVALEEIDDE